MEGRSMEVSILWSICTCQYILDSRDPITDYDTCTCQRCRLSALFAGQVVWFHHYRVKCPISEPHVVQENEKKLGGMYESLLAGVTGLKNACPFCVF